MQSKSDCRDTWVAVNVLVALECEFPNLHALVIGSARYVTEPSLTRGHEGPVAHTVVCGPGLSKRVAEGQSPSLAPLMVDGYL